jgi:hypothetical protein
MRHNWLEVCLMLACVVAVSAGRAQTNYFPIQLGSAGQEYGKALTVDNASNVVVALLFQNTIDFDPSPGSTVLGTPPGIDLALAKYDKYGQLVWARNVSGSAASVVTPHGVATDNANNIYVVGYFGLAGNTIQATATFGSITVTNSGGWDPFIAKYDSAGNALWVRVLTCTTPNTPTDERCWDLAVDNAGNVYATGYIIGTFDLDAGAGTSIWTSAGEKDVFLVKYDANGNFVWGFTLGDVGDPTTGLKETSVCLDNAGHVFLTGHFYGTMTVGTTNLTSAGQSDMFIARYTTNGVYDGVAVRIGGATYSEVAPPGTVRCDSSGNLYMTGRFRGIVDLNPGAGLNTVTNLNTTDNIWISSYTSALAFRWGFSIASNGGLDGGHRVAFDNQGHLYVAGWFAGSTNDFDGGPGTYILASTNAAAGAASDTFIAKYDKDTGAFHWARGFGGTVTDQTELSITAGLGVDGDGCAYVTGQFYGTGATHYSAAGPMAGAPVWNSTGMNDAYVIKYDAEGNLWVPPFDSVGDGIPDAWRAQHFGGNGQSTNATSSATADPDSDGIANLLEYAGNLNPNASNTTAALLGYTTAVSNSQNYLVIAHTRRTDSNTVTYTPQVSTDLSTWNSGSAYAEQIEVTPLDSVSERVSLRIKGPISQLDRQYARVLVTVGGVTKAAGVVAAERVILRDNQNHLAISALPATNALSALLSTNLFPAAATESAATVLDLWDQNTQALTTRYWNSNADGYPGWRESGTFADANNVALDLNKGFILTLRAGNGPRTNYFVGYLPRSAQTQNIQDDGYTLAGSFFPVPIALTNANLIASGFTGGISLVTSDQLLFFDPVTQLFNVKIWFDTTTSTWRDQDAAVATQQLQPNSAVLIKRRSRGSNFTWTNPVPYNVQQVWP